MQRNVPPPQVQPPGSFWDRPTSPGADENARTGISSRTTLPRRVGRSRDLDAASAATAESQAPRVERPAKSSASLGAAGTPSRWLAAAIKIVRHNALNSHRTREPRDVESRWKQSRTIAAPFRRVPPRPGRGIAFPRARAKLSTRKRRSRLARAEFSRTERNTNAAR